MDIKKGKKLIQLFCILIALSFFSILICNIAIADIYTQQELLTTDWRTLDTFIWQDFEYWDAPRSYGWKSSCPPYPVFGY